MVALRIFSYLPNPRIWKATIAARLCGVEVELRGAPPGELAEWLWDVDARPIAGLPPETLAAATRTGRIGFASTRLYKSDAFLEAQPFGTVPAAFSPDGRTGIFESNSIMRAVARLGESRFPLYGRDPYEASRIDGFLDASLVFARDSQIYLLALRSGGVTPELYARMRESFETWLSGIEQALRPQRRFLVGDDGLTLADIGFLAELCLFHNERARAAALAAAGLQPLLGDDFARTYPRASAHFRQLLAHPAVLPDAAGYLEKIERSARADAASRDTRTEETRGHRDL
jgi:glutathione S-transferase